MSLDGAAVLDFFGYMALKYTFMSHNYFMSG